MPRCSALLRLIAVCEGSLFRNRCLQDIRCLRGIAVCEGSLFRDRCLQGIAGCEGLLFARDRCLRRIAV